MARRLWEAKPASPVVLVLALILLVVAACTKPYNPAQGPDGDSPPPTSATETTLQQDTAPTEAVAKKASPPPKELSEPAPAPLAALETESPLAPAQIEVMPPINDDPHQLMGLAPSAVNRLLGPPSLLRTEAPAEVWQYTAEDCVLDIYLYAEEQMPDRSRVTYYEIRRSDTATRGARACFGEIIQSWNNTSGETP